MDEPKQNSDPGEGPTPFQLVRQLGKKYEHLPVEDRRRRVRMELEKYGLPEEVLMRLIREYA